MPSRLPTSPDRVLSSLQPRRHKGCVVGNLRLWLDTMVYGCQSLQFLAQEELGREAPSAETASPICLYSWTQHRLLHYPTSTSRRWTGSLWVRKHRKSKHYTLGQLQLDAFENFEADALDLWTTARCQVRNCRRNDSIALFEGCSPICAIISKEWHCTFAELHSTAPAASIASC